ncbi:MAG: hypothetical protein ACE5EH_11820 [Gammaproteobacteria bacterium]
MSKLIYYGCILLVVLPAHAFTPKIKHVQLEEFTTLVVDVIPDLGTRFVFPFILDEQDEYVPFTLNVTNPIFETARESGRNSFVVTAPPPKKGGEIPVYYSNMFVTVAGYNVSVALRTTRDLSSHVSDIVFDLSDEKRENVIQQQVKQRIKTIKSEYRHKADMLDEKLHELVLNKIGVLALNKPERNKIREEAVVVTEQGDRIRLYFNEVESYGTFHLFRYEITNEGFSPLKISDAALYVVTRENTEQRLVSSNITNTRIEPNQFSEGVIVTDYDQIRESRAIKLSVLTDSGAIEVQW